MIWNAAAAVAEIIGVFAVVVSVLYLAKQVKDGNDLNRTNTFRNVMHSLSNQNNVMFSPENAEMVTRGFASYSALPPVERIRFAHLMANFFLIPEDSWRSAQVNLLDDETMENWSWYLRKQFFPYRGVREWWEQYQSGYPPGFRDWIASVLEATDYSDDPYGIKGS